MAPDLRANFEALSKDASIWDEASTTLSTSGSTIAAIQVTHGAFSFAAMDLADQYAELHQRVTQLLADGAQAASNGAQALREVRDMYQQLEEGTASELARMWQPVI